MKDMLTGKAFSSALWVIAKWMSLQCTNWLVVCDCPDIILLLPKYILCTCIDSTVQSCKPTPVKEPG